MVNRCSVSRNGDAGGQKDNQYSIIIRVCKNFIWMFFKGCLEERNGLGKVELKFWQEL